MRRTAAGSKVKVKTEMLLSAVEARRAKMVTDHERAVTRAERDQAAYQGKVVDTLRKALEAAERGKLPTHDAGYRHKTLEITVAFDPPSCPDKEPLGLTEIDRLIATLKMAADDTITVSADDAAFYLG